MERHKPVKTEKVVSIKAAKAKSRANKESA
jgi:hypothetical protein